MMEHTPLIDAMHLVTAISYAVVGGVLWWCGLSPKFRFTLIRSEAERSFLFQVVAVFVLACFFDHFADAIGASVMTLQVTAPFEAFVSASTAIGLGGRAVFRWKSS